MSLAHAGWTTIEPIWIWGVPYAPLTLAQVVAEADRLIAARQPSYFITANLNYAMLSSRLPDLAEINRGAAFIVADGMPLVWASRRQGTPLPARVAGSDLIFALSGLAAERGYRLFLLGAPPGVAEQAATQLVKRFPGLIMAGYESPPFRPLSESENAALCDRIRAARPDLLLAGLGQPKGERWVFENYQALGVPLSAQVGASIDFAAGRVSRAPRWMQRTGLEWVYRLILEPRRLGGRISPTGCFS